MANSVSKYRSYQRIEKDLRQRVVRGEWSSGALLPGRRELARQYGVDVNTLQRAIGPLLDDGIFIAEGKRGTVVGSIGDPTPIVLSRQNNSTVSGTSAPGTEPQRISNLIGVLVRINEANSLVMDSNYARTRDAVRSIERAFAARGSSIEVVNMEVASGDMRRINGSIAGMRASGANAVIVIDVFDNPDEVAEMRALGYSDDPFTVYISSVGNYVPCPHVYFDQQHAGYAASTELLRRGWNSITFVAPYKASWLTERIEGARMATRQSGSSNPTFQTVPEEITANQYDEDVELMSRSSVREAFRLGTLTGGIIAPNDHLATMIIEEAENFGQLLGVDFGVVGFDDDPESSLCGLSSVRPPFEEMGTIAADLVIRRLTGEFTPMQVCAQSHLIPRTSSKRPLDVYERSN